MCCNATETHKFKMMIIRHAARPQCFGKVYDQLRDDKVIYEYNKTSWMDCKAFITWMTRLNDEMLNMGKKGWLLISLKEAR
jgi:hypothetical protein